MENTRKFDWYDLSGNIAPREDITEVKVVGNHTPTGNEVEWRYVSSEGEHIATAYANGTKLTLVLKDLTSIPDRTFHKFLALEEVTGLSSVKTIGESAFCYTPKLSSMDDIVPSNLESIGASAFRMSGAEDVLDLSGVDLKVVGDKATRHKRWSVDGLAAIKSFWEGLQNQTGSLQKVFLDVPNIESQYKYDYLNYCKVDGEYTSVAASGCAAVNLYHVWNAYYAGTVKQYDNFEVWFANALEHNPDTFVPQGNTSLAAQVAKLGWEFKRIDYIESSKASERLNHIVSSLANGFPVSVRTNSPNIIGGYHSCAIVGYDVANKKLAITDSAVLDSQGVISWIAFEDIFSGGYLTTGDTDMDGVYIIDFKRPVLAPNCSWFTQGNTSIKRANIENIIIQTEPYKGNATTSWVASEAGSGTVTAYVDGATLTLVSNDIIWTGQDASYLFSDSGSDKFKILEEISGAEWLNTRRAQTLQGAFDQAFALKKVNVSNWNTSSCTTMRAMFQCAKSLEALDLSRWDVSKVTSMYCMFQGHPTLNNGIIMSLTTIGDVSNWDTSAVTTMKLLFRECRSLEVDVSAWKVDSVTEMDGMFSGCMAIRELDLSGWNISENTTMTDMLSTMTKLEKLAVSDTFRFTGCGIAAPPTDLPFATGYWQDRYGKSYELDKLADNPTRVYYASAYVVAGDDGTMVFVKNGTLRQIAIALRYKNGKSDTMCPSEFAEEVLAL